MTKIKLAVFIFFSCITFSVSSAENSSQNECDRLKPNFENKELSSKELYPYAQCSLKHNQKQFLSKEFNFNYENDAQMAAFITQLHVDYFRNLRQCRPGVYKYIVAWSLVTSTVHGIKNNKCIVDISSRESPELVQNRSAVNTEQKCEYERENLLLFTDQAAEDMADKNKHNAEAVKAVIGMERYCKALPK